jgi:hypothetical protein
MYRVPHEDEPPQHARPLLQPKRAYVYSRQKNPNGALLRACAVSAVQV